MQLSAGDILSPVSLSHGEVIVLRAPDDCFVDFVIESQTDAKKDTILLKFDAFDFERELYKIKSKLIHQSYLRDHLRVEYTDKYITGPLKNEVAVATADTESAAHMLEIANDRFRTAAVTRAITIDSPNRNERELIESTIRQLQKEDNLAQKTSEILENIKIWSSEQDALLKTKAILEMQIAQCTVVAPGDCRFVATTFGGAFVKKDTVLLEVTIL